MADAPDRNERSSGPGIGADEWVAREGEHRQRRIAARVSEAVERIPPALRLAAIVVPLVVIPIVADSDYQRQVALDTVIFMLLALGLNVTVGWVGVLDLGYVAFFGLGAYFYAAVASVYAGRYWDAQWAIPAVIAATALVGLLVGLPSRRLAGDYLAIVTLFFFQIFFVVANNSEVTLGPNGIADVLPLQFFSWTADMLLENYYVAVGAFAVVMGVLYLVNASRTGRAWRALREDELAAELMTMPVDRLKLMGFAFGAGVAGLAGLIFSAQQGAVFPADFTLPLLITIYAMVVLGGAGSLVGVAVGVVLINLSLEVLREPTNASVLFFGVLVVGLVVMVRPWWRLLSVAGATVLLGVVVHELAEWLRPSLVAGETVGQARIDDLVSEWVLLPVDLITPDGLPAGAAGRLMYITLVAAILGLTMIRSSLWRTIALPPVLYLAACVWENLLLPQASVTRFILIGAMLVTLMAARPQGLLGKQRVEII